MSRDTRRSLIAEIEDRRGSRVITYVTSDRAPTPAQMANDAVRRIYDHLRPMGHVENLDVFIYSRGGDIDVPWRIATALRGASDHWNVLVPLAANSAATLLALGADQIVLGPQGELGPIDPQMLLQRGGETPMQETVGVEDVMSYVKFVTERAGLSDQAALAEAVSKLAEKMDPTFLGRIYRTHSHIREVAGQMLRSRRPPPNEQTMGTIIETLAERVYAHGHAVGFPDAKDVGLPVELASSELDTTMWALLNEYEDEMKLLDPIDPRTAVEQKDTYEEDVSLAIIESTSMVHELKGTLQIEAQRQVPPQLAVNVNLNLQMPPVPQPVPADVAAFIQQVAPHLQQDIAQAAQKAVEEAVQAQAPLVGALAFLKNPHWEQTTEEPPSSEGNGEAEAG